MSLKKKDKARLLLAGVFLLGFLSGLFIGRLGHGGKDGAFHEKKASVEGAAEGLQENTAAMAEEPDSLEGPREMVYYTKRISYGKTFCDLNEKHVRVADSLGLPSVPKTRDHVDLTDGLIRIEDNGYYIVDELRYSIPYLTNGGAKELWNIAKAFNWKLVENGLPEYKLVVSSVLRTEEDVNRLRRSGNPNASDNSAHCYGTTFDISYTRYFREDETEVLMRPYELTKVLAEVLRDERDAGRCIVKYERKEHCFHITSCIR